MRQKIKDIEAQIDALNTTKQSCIDTYLATENNYIFISDHALVRYMERIENILLLGSTDAEKLLSYPGDLGYFRKKVLPKELQKKILKDDKGWYRQGQITYIVKNLTLITIIKQRTKR